MKFKLRFATSAVRDIEQVLSHTLNQFGERKYEQYKELIRQALADIATNPKAPPARPRAELHPDARTFHLARRGKPARHFFLYLIVVDQFIEVGRLLHDSMDLERHLPEGFKPD